ncbi:MAG TPA: hypothetical protein V6C57_26470 [Coleofasciculaceae cyanobacterium]
MPTRTYLLEFAIAELFVQVSLSGRITLADRHGLQAALLTESLSDEERFAIDRLLYAVRKGRVKMVNELSAVS